MSETPITETGQDITVAASDVAAQIDALNTTGAGLFSTITGDSVEDRKAVFNAITDPEPISDNLGKTINLAHVVAQRVEVADTETGSVEAAARVILIDADGTAYAGLSDGLLRSMHNLFGIIGKPGESEAYPLPVKIVEAKSRKGFRFFTMKLA